MLKFLILISTMRKIWKTIQYRNLSYKLTYAYHNWWFENKTRYVTWPCSTSSGRGTYNQSINQYFYATPKNDMRMLVDYPTFLFEVRNDTPCLLYKEQEEEKRVPIRVVLKDESMTWITFVPANEFAISRETRMGILLFPSIMANVSYSHCLPNTY